MDMICIGCPMGCSLQVEVTGEEILVSGNSCKRGEDFAMSEIKNPRRSLTTTVRTIFKDMPLLPVRTDGEVPKDKIFQAMEVLNKVVITERVKCSDVVVENILESGCNVIATASIKETLNIKGTTGIKESTSIKETTSIKEASRPQELQGQRSMTPSNNFEVSDK